MNPRTLGILANAMAVVFCLVGCSGGGSSSSSTPIVTTYSLDGTITGLSAGQSASLQDNGGATLTLSANGAFSFPTSLNTGSAYAVTVQSHTPGITCSVSGGSGTVGSSNVTNIAVSCAAGTETILYSFSTSNSFQRYPRAGLVMDSVGNLYGTTWTGGATGGGTVFEVSAAGTESILYAFGASATDGEGPWANLTLDSAGNLYGTTTAIGTFTTYGGGGTVFVIN